MTARPGGDGGNQNCAVKPNRPVASEKSLSDALCEISINFREIYRSPNWCLWVSWLCMFIVCCGLCAMQLYMQTIDFFHYETKSTSVVEYNHTMEFPSLTICTENYLKPEVDVESLDLSVRMSLLDEDGQYVEMAKLTNEFYVLNNQMPETNEQTLADFVAMVGDRTGVFSREQITKIADKVSWGCEEFIISCSTKPEDLRCPVVSEFFSRGTKCCQLKVPVDHQYYEGKGGGLKLQLQQPTNNRGFCGINRFVKTDVCGWQFHLNPPGHGTTLNSNNMVTLSSSQGWIKMQRMQDINLPPPYGECSADVSLKYFTRYSDSNCRMETHIQAFEEVCGCVPYGMFQHLERNASIPVCQMMEMVSTCDVNIVSEKATLLAEADCPFECDKISYDTSVEIRPGEIDLSWAAYDNFSVYAAFMDMRLMQYHLYYPSFSTNVNKKSPAVSKFDLVSKIGGAFALWLGFKLITFFQFFYFLFWWIARKLENPGGADRRMETTKTTVDSSAHATAADPLTHKKNSVAPLVVYDTPRHDIHTPPPVSEPAHDSPPSFPPDFDRMLFNLAPDPRLT